jgi:hypothetical protein
MAFLNVYKNGIYTVAATSYYQQLVPQGEIYTQGHGIPPCIYQNGIYTVLATSYYQQLVPQGRNIPQGHGPPCIYQNGIYGAAFATTSSLCHKGEIYT